MEIQASSIETTSIQEIVDIAKRGEHCRIGIDGLDGAGKSTLAKLLSSALAFPVIELDQFLDRDQGGFVEFLQYPALKTAVQAPTIVVEGVCLLEVLDRLNCAVDLLVYVQRTRHGIWLDEDEYAHISDVEAAIERAQRNRYDFAMFEARSAGRDAPSEIAPLPGLVEELIRYHGQYRPHLKANVLFKRGRS